MVLGGGVYGGQRRRLWWSRGLLRLWSAVVAAGVVGRKRRDGDVREEK
jgi:hypothetical protein